MPPAFECGDFQPVDLKRGPVLFATYGPANQIPPNDVTQQLRQIQMTRCSDNLQIAGGIHTRIGDPAPGVPKLLKIWFLNAPCEQYVDFQQVDFRGRQVLFASYCPVDFQGNGIKDVTAKIKDLQSREIQQVTGGIHTVIGDDWPGVPKLFKVWYA